MKKTLCLLAAFSLLASVNTFAGDKRMKTFDVTITNITTEHIITPPAVIAHSGKFELFQLGMPASDELAYLAENGNPTMVLDKASMEDGVFAVAAGGDGIMPGQSLTVTIKAPWNSHFTVAGMLAGTNDAFVSATTAGVFWGNGKRMAYADTYDAGSEENNEKCDYIPGPPCANNSNLRATENSEGYVTIHKGIFGPLVVENSGLKPEKMDWRGPNAVVTVELSK